MPASGVPGPRSPGLVGSTGVSPHKVAKYADSTPSGGVSPHKAGTPRRNANRQVSTATEVANPQILPGAARVDGFA